MLEGVFSVRCPSIFTTGASLYEDFEMGSSKFGSSAVTDTVPFCGRYSYKNPSEVFPIPESNRDTLQLALYPWVCFDYHPITLNHTNKDPKKEALENPVGKRENAGNQHFLLFPQCFLLYQREKLSF